VQYPPVFAVHLVILRCGSPVPPLCFSGRATGVAARQVP
jgi:hypothetical protein